MIDDIYMKYENGYEATVKEHKHNLVRLIRGTIDYTKTDQDLYDCSVALEEYARALNELDIEWQDDTRVEMCYSQDMNHFTIKKTMTYEERFNKFAEDNGLSAKMYCALVKLALGRPESSSQGVQAMATESAYKAIMTALGE